MALHAAAQTAATGSGPAFPSKSIRFLVGFAPGGTPKPIVDRLYNEIARVLKMPDIRERLLRDGIEPIGSTPEQFMKHTKKEAVKWGKVVKDSGRGWTDFFKDEGGD